MRDECPFEARHNADHDGGIRTAVGAWFSDPAAAKARYGPIASWDTSGITGMHGLFCGKEGFNEDISRWNVTNVVDMSILLDTATLFNCDLSCWDVGQIQYMRAMFSRATSFDRQLGGAWATSTANKTDMFNKSPGTIAGKTNNAYAGYGTPE